MMTTSVSKVQGADGSVCPLCGNRAQVAAGIAEVRVALLACPRCRAFVMERRLIDVITNARAWNLRPVLRHVAYLSRAAQEAASHGAVLFITSTNWIRLSNEQQRLDGVGAAAFDTLSLT